MRTTTNIVSLLLVDIRLGGTGASDLSDWLVKQKLAQTVSIVTSTVHRNGGIVATRFGQTLLCTFPKVPAAVSAASEILATSTGPADDSVTGSRRKVDVRLAMNHGRMVVAAGNISGEVVDVVGMLAETVEPDTIVATQAVLDALPQAAKAAWRDLGERKVEGLAKPLRVFQLAEGSATVRQVSPAPAGPKAPAAAPVPPPAPAPAPAAPPPPKRATTATLTMGAEARRIDADSPVLHIGRNKDNDLVVAEPHVSRRHATVEYRLDGFYLINASVNGTTVIIDGVERTVGENEVLRMPPSGQIALAPSLSMAAHEPIQFNLT